MDHTNKYDGTFEFAFNDPCFSDRVLKVMVIAGPQDEKLKAKLGDGLKYNWVVSPWESFSKKTASPIWKAV
ncbi:hypothetical protein QJS10_CPB21g01411 [Acorus calamus]|uniref:Uncharacterized protein n=1 Tax=Acorus calamus TaxID=4465 RepID=A0AAV9C7S0_ACOCL|nr:hypothetical protein QJS10_CPB21g01411 [Acorus calamus]